MIIQICNIYLLIIIGNVAKYRGKYRYGKKYLSIISPLLQFDTKTHSINGFTDANQPPPKSIDQHPNRTALLQNRMMNSGKTNRLMSKNIHDEETGTSGYYSQLENQEDSSSLIHFSTASSAFPTQSLYRGQNHSKKYLFDRHQV